MGKVIMSGVVPQLTKLPIGTTWKRYAVNTVYTYYWDRYNVNSEQVVTGYTTTTTILDYEESHYRSTSGVYIGNTFNSSTGYFTGGTHYTLYDISNDIDNFIGKWYAIDDNYATQMRRISGCNSNFIMYDAIQDSKEVIQTKYSKGSTSYGQVSSTNRNAYPTNNYSGSYWYVYSTSTSSTSRGNYIDDVISRDENAYPTDGIHTDGYWYVKVET